MLSQSTNERMNEKFEIYTQRARPNGLIKRTQAQTQTHTERNFFSKSSYKKKSVVCCLLQLSHVFRFAMKRLFLRIK